MPTEEINLQHINFKLFIKGNPEINFSEFNPVFQTWIQQKLTEELLIDVADYLHVPSGPGMLLVGFEADYSMDQTKGRWGLRYNRKKELEGDNPSKLKYTLKKTLEACQRLENAAPFKGKLQFKTDEIEFFINDRATAPNTPETMAQVQPKLEKLMQTVWTSFTSKPEEDKRQRLGFLFKSAKTKSLDEMIQAL